MSNSDPFSNSKIDVRRNNIISKITDKPKKAIIKKPVIAKQKKSITKSKNKKDQSITPEKQVLFSIHTTPDIKRKVKIKAVQEGKTITEIINEFMLEYINKK